MTSSCCVVPSSVFCKSLHSTFGKYCSHATLHVSVELHNTELISKCLKFPLFIMYQVVSKLLVKLCSGMIEAGRAYVSANKLFVNGIRDLSQQCKKEEMISVSRSKDIFNTDLQEMVNYHTVRHICTHTRTDILYVVATGERLRDIRKFKDTKKQFDRVREDMELAQVKNAQAPRNKVHEAEEATQTLILSRKAFRHLALDYVLQINVLQAKKKFEILDAMLSFMRAQYTLFQQGFNILDEIDPYMKKLAAQLDQLVIDSAVEKRELEHKHALIQQRDFSYDDPKLEFNVDAPNGVVMEGYLFKRASNAFKTWNRRWFSIQNSQLVYQKKLKDSLTVVVEDLRLCSVKPCEDNERRFCFEVVSPTKSCMLQAESEKLRQAWIQAVQASIASAYKDITDNYYIERLDRTASPSTSSIDSASEPRERGERADKGVRGGGESLLQRVQSLPGNELCSDCGQTAPCWASINLGVLLCIECSGIHRSLGVHFSKVRSLTLDSWEPELLKLMCELGNTVINQIYEGSCEELGAKKPGPSSSRQEKEAWIKSKYVEKRFLKKMSGSEALVQGERKSRPWTVKKCQRHNSSVRSEESSSGEVEIEQEVSSDPEDPRELHPGALLYRSSRLHNLPLMAEALAHGADVHAACEEEEGKTPLIQAVIGGSLIACEFLLQNGADVNQRDMRGRGPLHHATDLGHTGQVCLFLKRGASQTEVDEQGHDPLSIAVQAANADIVTLLRLARMNEEMREAEAAPLGQPGQYPTSSPTEQQYRKCIQEFICLNIDEC
uniref:Arf-GAP with coiled-coil, ANK repeat and PH domain-containing protein n=1 Tax=Astatotilapia calliptera TaxID=8154 RepID=A0AAX7VTS5_ASTCA